MMIFQEPFQIGPRWAFIIFSKFIKAQCVALPLLVRKDYWWAMELVLWEIWSLQIPLFLWIKYLGYFKFCIYNITSPEAQVILGWVFTRRINWIDYFIILGELTCYLAIYVSVIIGKHQLVSSSFKQLVQRELYFLLHYSISAFAKNKNWLSCSKVVALQSETGVLSFEIICLEMVVWNRI